MTRRVQHYEADSMQHVNNAIYFDWLEEPLALLAAQWKLPHSMRLCARRHTSEFLRGALPGDEVEIHTKLSGVGRRTTLWTQEIRRAGELLVRNQLTALWLDDQDQPIDWAKRFG